jgi:hypothetical protein
MERRNRGQNMVEFALILPLLLMVLLALIDGAFIVQGYLTVNHAAREAVRFATAYQPDQGKCLDRDRDGVYTDEPWPYCPIDYAENDYETDEDYYERRVRLIKIEATEAALGLRMETVCDGNPMASSTCIDNYLDEPGMFGIQVWGLPSFEDPAQEDHPGLQGLTVRVRVVHNVPLTVFAPLTNNPFVRVTSSMESINEGVQVGYGNLVPPTIAAPPVVDPGDPPQHTVTPGPTFTQGPTPTPTPIPVYNLALDFETATNELPAERQHDFAAHVTSPEGDNIAGAKVTFRTNGGSFAYAGIGSQVVQANTGANGLAPMAIFANEPLTATIEAWLDYDSDGNIDANEPSDTATKIWQATGAYLIVSDHHPAPADTIGVDLMDHPSSGNSHSLWWCPDGVTSTTVIEQLAYPVDVNAATWDTDATVPVDVPLGVAGFYRIESHTGDGGSNPCGNGGTLIAYSAPLQIAEVPPDLIIADLRILNAPDEILSGYPLTVEVEVENLAPVAVVDTPFDVDLYLNLEEAPYAHQLGDVKQWLTDLGPFETTLLTITLQNTQFGNNNLWAQVDTTDYIDEGVTGGEDNNIFGPVDFDVDCGIPDPDMSDTFDGGLGGQWYTQGVGGANGSHSSSGGQLEVTSNGSTIWGGSNSFYYIYQPIEGDFDARLRVIQQPSTSNWAKFGLHVRQFADDPGSPYLQNVATNDRNPAGTQAGYRDYDGGGGNRAGGDQSTDLPVWMRLVRRDNSYEYYYTTVDDPQPSDWILQGTHDAPNPMDYIGIAHASYSSNYGTGIADEFKICTESADKKPIHPPGLVQCSELLYVPGFEGNYETVFEYWKRDTEGGTQRSSMEMYRGSFSMRSHASFGVYPCPQSNLQPFIYQDVVFPTEVYSISTLTVEGQYLVTKSIFECSPGGPDIDDVLYLRVQDTGGTDLTAPTVITNGGAPPSQWLAVQTDMSSLINLEDHAGERVRLYWNATHDEDYNGTFFYMDELSAEVCTEWPIPDDEPDTASFGGLITTLGEYHAPVILPGAHVWAYAQGGAIYQTQAIHDGTYHFYNIPPGTYVVYAESWVSGALRTATTVVTVAADERNYGVNLLLQ